MAKQRYWPADHAELGVLCVRDPRTMRPIDPYDGLEVDDTDPHFARLLRDGDIVTERPAGREPAAEPNAELAPKGKPVAAKSTPLES